MKVIFYLLLLGNVVLYLWETGGGRSAQPLAQVELKLPDNVEPIRLLKELPGPPSKSSQVAVADAGKAIITAVETEGEPGEPPPGVSIVQPPPPPPPPVVNRRCYLYGPYENDAAAKVALGQFSQFKDTEVVTRTEATTEGYWVLYPKADNIYAARANRKMLMDKGVQDTWVFDKGELEFAISLGVFKTKERADGLQQQLRAKDIEVEVRPRLTRAETYWLQLTWPGEPEDLGKLLPQNAKEALKPCN